MKDPRHRVPAEVLRSLLQAIDRCGHDPAPYLGGLGEVRALTLPGASASWTSLVELVETFHRQQGHEELKRVVRELISTLPLLRRLANLLLPPRMLLRALFEVVGRAELVTIQADAIAATSSLQVRLEVARSLKPSSVLLEAFAEFLSAWPRLFDLPTIEVLCTVSSGHTATYRFEVPRARGFHVRPSDSQLATIIDDLAPEAGEPTAAPSVAMLEHRYALTRAESRIVRRLATGRSLGEIAHELGVGTETVRTHTKRAMQKTGTHRQAELVALLLRPSR